MADFDLLARLKLDDQLSSPMGRISKQMGDVERKTKSLSSGMKGFGKSVLAIGGAIGLTKVASSGFRMLRDSIGDATARIDAMEQFERTMNVMVNDTDKVSGAMERLQGIVKGTSMRTDNMTKSIQGFVTRGLEIDKATDHVEAWGNAVSFYGDGSNEQFSQVTDALHNMVSKGKVDMQQMNRITQSGIPAVEIYADAVGKNTDDVQKALSSGEISAEDFVDTVSTAFMKGTDKFDEISTAMKDEGSSWGSIMENIGSHISLGMMDIITAIDDGLEELGLPSIRDMIDDTAQRARGALTKIAEAVPPFINKIKEAWEALEPWQDTIKSIGKALLIASGSMAGLGIAAGVLAGIIAVASMVSAPVWIAVGAITALATGFQLAYDNIEPFRQKVEEVFNAFKELFSGESTGEDFLKAIGFSDEQIEKLTEFSDTVVEKFTEFKDVLLEKFEEIQPGVEMFMDTFDIAKEVVMDVFTTLASVAMPILSALGTAFSILADVAVMVFNNIIAPVIKLIWTLFQTAWKIIGPILTLIGQYIKREFGKLKVVWDNVIKPVVKYMMTDFKESIENAIDVIQRIGGWFDTWGEKVRTVVNAVKDVVSWLNKVTVPDALKKAGELAGRVFGGGGGTSSSHYHGIDYVPKDGYNATLHKGERVLTAQENKNYNKGGNVSVNVSGVTIREEADIDRFTDALVAKIIAAQEAGA